MTTAAYSMQSATMSPRRTLRAYLIEAKYELLRLIRMPSYAIPMLPLPIFLYLLIGIVVVGPQAAKDPNVAPFLFSAFVVFAVTSPGMFGFGIGFAVERQSGLLTLKRAQPMPPVAYLLAKIVASLLCVALVIAVLTTMATLFGRVTLTGTQIVQVILASLLGMAAFCAMGLFIGSLVRGSAAPGIVNVIYFPMMYLSGMFFPLPKALAPWAMIWPTFYLDQLMLSITLGKSAIGASLCIAVLLGLTVLFGGLAARRLARANI